MVEVREFTRQEVALRDGKNGNPTWVIIRDMVYDVTPYLNEHPGGSELIADFAGKDATKDFDDFGHSGTAMSQLKLYKVGELNMSTDPYTDAEQCEWEHYNTP
ncbi:cytochrome b5 [Culex quinquefasciatus]|uniref:Cytochrome b5 n=1 Tax=Culex quinquefasciatus TaxID=7176 RepID=B0VZK7_CULQU|nr:cytochrome b5 [Culex quinquefasciatus]|eukprot:XP_001841891.1 cytochrome b5 [Culex quinquefasciatus]